jgi:hypothetical protein
LAYPQSPAFLFVRPISAFISENQTLFVYVQGEFTRRWMTMWIGPYLF